MPSAQVLQLADKLLGVPTSAAVSRVIAWARGHVPTEAELPANLFAYWDRAWDARRDRTSASAVPDADETRRRMREAEARARQ